MLLSTEQIRQGLDEQFMPLEPMLTGLRLIPGGESDETLCDFERALGTSLPSEFTRAIKSYNFGQLTIGPVAFCNSGTYLEELKRLNDGEVNWWGSETKPPGLLMIANSDPYAILLDIQSGAVLAMEAERGWKAARTIAGNFDLFVRGVGTTMLRRTQGSDLDVLAREVASEAQSVDISYWLELAK